MHQVPCGHGLPSQTHGEEVTLLFPPLLLICNSTQFLGSAFFPLIEIEMSDSPLKGT